MSLLTLRKSMRDTLAAQVKDLAQVHEYGGRFSAADARRFATLSPSVVIAALNVRSSTVEGDVHVVNVQWGAYLLVADTKTAPRHAIALTLLELLLGVVRPDQRWGDVHAQQITEVRADNLYSPELDSAGVGLWAITWLQPYDVNAFNTSALEDFLRYRGTWDLGSELEDTPKAQDSVDLEAIS